MIFTGNLAVPALWSRQLASAFVLDPAITGNLNAVLNELMLDYTAGWRLVQGEGRTLPE